MVIVPHKVCAVLGGPESNEYKVIVAHGDGIHQARGRCADGGLLSPNGPPELAHIENPDRVCVVVLTEAPKHQNARPAHFRTCRLVKGNNNAREDTNLQETAF
jgi:hypothetical protein